MRKHCKLLSVSRSSVGYRYKEERKADLEIKRLLDEIYPKDPYLGSRRLVTVLRRDHGIAVNRKRLKRLRREMGLVAIWCRPRTSRPDQEGRKHPYLLRDRRIDRVDEVWCADITYVPMGHGYAYLCAVMDWYSRKVLGWAVSNTMETGLSLSGLNQALSKTDRTPQIFNTDQGCQFTSSEWIDRLEVLGVRVSMDGKGRWMDNVFIECLWRSGKYEDISLEAYRRISDLRTGLKKWFEQYNEWRPHEALDNEMPSAVYNHRSDEKASRKSA